MSIIIASHNNGEGARNLAEALGCRLMSLTSRTSLPRGIRFVVNLGISEGEKLHALNDRLSRSRASIPVLNNPAQVLVASSKRNTLVRLRNEGVSVPWFTTDITQANYKVLVEGATVVARTLDRASEGRGIEVLTPERVTADGGLLQAPVYTEAIDKGREYRVHVGFVNGVYQIIDIQRKIRRPGVDDTDRPFIWNHSNDFIFVRNDVNERTVPQQVQMAALSALRVSGLHFGAVDIVMPRRGRADINDMPAYVLEINTSPGMTGRTVERYAEYFRAVTTNSSFRQWSELPNDTEQEEI